MNELEPMTLNHKIMLAAALVAVAFLELIQ